jgi:hypothetical protein
MIKLRMDVDYPYPSRPQSFFFTVINRKIRNNYLKNAKIIAKMVNESPRDVKAYWFFTPMTTPDKEMMALMHPERHEVALHVATDPYGELALLEKVTQRKLNYYTIHGTARLFARLMWKRKISQARVPTPAGFPLKDFWDFPTLQLDLLCYGKPTDQAIPLVEEGVTEGKVLHAHPEWLFRHGKFNHRGPYYDTLKRLLDVDADLVGLRICKKGFAKIASYGDTGEYQKDTIPTRQFMDKLVDRGVDIFSFLERKWCCNIPNPPKEWVKTEDNIGLLQLASYKEWWDGVGKKTRNMVRKAEKSGVTTAVIEQNQEVATGIWKIYNETPIRQGRAFSHYGRTLENVSEGILNAKDCTFVGAFFEGELVGFIELVHGDKLTIIAQILSMQKYWDKAVNNALIAKSIEVCANRKVQWLMYGRMGNHPTLDSFKESNSFTKFPITRYYVPLTRKGRAAIKLGLHRDLKDTLPMGIKRPLFPVFSWVSRTKMHIRLKLHQE